MTTDAPEVATKERELLDFLLNLRSDGNKAKAQLNEIEISLSSKIASLWEAAEEQERLNRGEPRRCHAARDDECIWSMCPQNRDGEPRKSGRHCPLDTAAREREARDD